MNPILDLKSLIIGGVICLLLPATFLVFLMKGLVGVGLLVLGGLYLVDQVIQRKNVLAEREFQYELVVAEGCHTLLKSQPNGQVELWVSTEDQLIVWQQTYSSIKHLSREIKSWVKHHPQLKQQLRGDLTQLPVWIQL